MFRSVAAAVAGGVALLGALGTASAAPVSWNLTTCGSGSPCNGTERTFIAAGGEVLKARAFWLEDDGIGNFQTASLGQYSGGLGVTNHFLDSHTVDNVNRDDFIVFMFPTVGYIPVSTFLTRFNDTDISAWVGGNSLAGFGSITSLNLGNLVANGFTAYTSPGAQLGGPESNRLALLNQTSLNLSGKFLIIGAALGNDDDDEFKIRTLNAETPTPAVPEPSTFMLLGTAVAGVAGAAWRRHRRQQS